MTEWDDFKAEILADKNTRDAYDARKPKYELASALISLRKKHGWSQRDLAREAGLKQPHIARIERGDVSPTWETVMRLVTALGAEIEILPLHPGAALAHSEFAVRIIEAESPM